MANETVRANLIDAINEMTRLLEVCPDSNLQFEIRIRIRELFQRLDRVIVATLDSGTQEFADAIASLQTLTAAAIEAKSDITRISETVNHAADAIRKVEKLVKNVTGVLKIV